MKLRAIAIILSILFLTAGIPLAVNAQNTATVEVTMVGEVRRQQGATGFDIMVAGVLHNMSIGLNTPSTDIDVLFYKNETLLLTNANLTNTYRWTYKNGVWNDTLYDFFIEPEESGVYGTNYYFHLGINANATTGNWVLSVKVDGAEEFNGTVVVEQPITGIAVTGTSTFYVHLAPYRTGFFDSANPDDPGNATFFRYWNSGNVPLEIDVSYDIYENRITTTNDTGILHLGRESERRGYITFQADSSWSPNQFVIVGQIRGSPLMLDTPASVSLKQAVGTNLKIDVTLARPGFQIAQIKGFVAQYKNRYYTNYTDEVTMDLYFTGWNPSYLTTVVDNLTLEGITLDDVIVSEPVLITVNNNTEAHMVVKINATVPPPGKQSMLTYVTFTMENQDTETNGEFVTTIVVLPKEIEVVKKPFGIGSLNIYSLIFIILAIIGIGVFMLQHRRKLFERRMKEEEKKKKAQNRRDRRKKRR